MTSPNIIYIMLDEWGYFEWSAMEHPILETPNIDKMASEGMRFTQMLAGGNVCAPTRCALMTGQHTGHTTIRANGGGLALRADKDEKWDARNQRGPYDAQMYAAMVEMVDRQLGEIMDLLKELQIDEKTIVFICGDNGGAPYFANESHPHGFFAPNLNPGTSERFRGGKGNFYEGGLRVPFIVRWPGRIEPGTVSDHLGYFPDVMPTLAELTGTKPGSDIDGISVAPTLQGEAGRKQEQHEYLYWEDLKSCAVRMGSWKAVRPDKDGPFELYDLSTDIEELNDVAAQHSDILEKMMRYAKKAHTQILAGQILDASMGFKGHDAD